MKQENKQSRNSSDFWWNDLLDSKTYRLLRHVPFVMSFLGISFVMYDYGFNQVFSVQKELDVAYMSLLGAEVVFLFVRYFFSRIRPAKKVLGYDLSMVVLILLTLSVLTGIWDFPLFQSHYWRAFVFLMVFLRELSAERIEFRRRYINPAQLFLFSFLGIILLGTFALMFPNATVGDLSFIDALFTSTSAVCVTGLTVVDTGIFFTPVGQVIILILIQLGGLGIMTFTSYFSYFFTGESSYENQLMIQEMTGLDQLSEVFRTLKKVILLTLIVELGGAVFIFFQLDAVVLPGFGERLFFSVFHAVSGFCNAGFSTLTNSLYEIDYRFNYPFHLLLAILIILGGIGFPLLFNFFNYVRHFFTDLVFRKHRIYVPWIISLHSRIVLVTTILLMVLGTGLFYVFECNNTLAEHGGIGKIVTAFFGAVTPRTAGFNTVDTSILNTSTVFLVFFLMWVGASPGSTGGGIKTSTFAISIMNAVSIARGKGRIECYGREVSDSTVRRAFSHIFLSFVAIGVSVFSVSMFEKNLELKSVIFECISAFSTVGLSLGITAKLSLASKLVIITTMFVGRISMMTFLAAFFKSVKYMKHRYPSEDILIN